MGSFTREKEDDWRAKGAYTHMTSSLKILGILDHPSCTYLVHDIPLKIHSTCGFFISFSWTPYGPQALVPLQQERNLFLIMYAFRNMEVYFPSLSEHITSPTPLYASISIRNRKCSASIITCDPFFHPMRMDGSDEMMH